MEGMRSWRRLRIGFRFFGIAGGLFTGASVPAEPQKFEPAFLFAELQAKGKVRTETRLGPPEYPCDEHEVIDYQKLLTCKGVIVFKRRQVKGCWGVTTAGNWEMETPSIGYVNPQRLGILGYADHPVKRVKAKPGVCPDLLIRLSGEEFGRVYHKTGYGVFRYDAEEKSFVRKTKPRSLAPRSKKQKSGQVVR
jgi:hypothetical protein